MNTHDKYDLPPLPRPQVPIIGANIDLIGIRRLAAWCERTAKDYAIAAVEADRTRQGDSAKVLAELVALIPPADTLNASASCQDLIDYFKGIFAERKRRGEPSKCPECSDPDLSPEKHWQDGYDDGIAAALRRGEPVAWIRVVGDRLIASRRKWIYPQSTDDYAGTRDERRYAAIGGRDGDIVVFNTNLAETDLDDLKTMLAWQVSPQPAERSRGEPVAYLDLGVGGYMDVGTDLTDEHLASLPKGRHMLAIVGPHGVYGYTEVDQQPAEPANHSVQDCPEDDKWNCKYCTRVNSCPVQGHRDAQPAEPVSQHPDDAAVDAFAATMKAKLAKKRAEGRGGWRMCSAEYLSRLLREHVEKGDPVDVANLAMMLSQNGQPIEATEPMKLPSDDVLAEALSNLEHDNYEQSYRGYKNRQADIGLIRAALQSQEWEDAVPYRIVVDTALKFLGTERYERFMGELDHARRVDGDGR